MNRTQIVSAIFLLPITASLLLVGGLYMMENGNEQPEQTGNPEASSLNGNNSSGLPENTIRNRNSTESNQSIQNRSGTQLNFMKEEKIQPVSTGKDIDQAFNDLLENRTNLAQQLLKSESSIVLLYEGSDSKALLLLNTPLSNKTSVNLTLEGFKVEEVIMRGGSLVNRSEEREKLYSVGWKTSKSTAGAAFILKDSTVDVKIRPQFLGKDIEWKLVSGPRKNLRFIELDRELPLYIDTG